MSRIVLGLLVACFLAAAPARAEEVSVELAGATPGLTIDLFRGTLGPHGEWLRSPTWGEVWRPRVALGWRPYYYGSWAWSDEGWYWDSSEPFAWAVYHYGRWVFDATWGWVWVPGYEWAPAWVTWRYGAESVGWAPLGPGVSVFVTSYPFVDVWWTFVPVGGFVGVPVHTVAYGPRETPRWFRNTAPAPPRTLAPPRAGAASGPAAPAWGGPSRRVIEDRIGRPLTPMVRPPAPGPGAWRGSRPGGAGAEHRGVVEPPGRGPVERGQVEPPARGPGERPAGRQGREERQERPRGR